MKGKVIAAIACAAVALSSSASAGSTCVSAADKGQDQRAAGKLKEARATFLGCAQSTCKEVIRNDCERWIREIDKDIPSIVVRVTDARKHDVLGVTLTIDDAPLERDGSAPVLVDPGPHVVRARTAAGDVAESKAHVVVGEHARIVDVRFDRALEEDGSRYAEPLQPAAKPEEPSEVTKGPSLVLPLTLGAVGVVALGTFGVFQWQGRRDFAELENGCGRTRSCTDAETAPVKEKFAISIVALGMSAVALGAAAYFFFTGKGEALTTATARLAPGGIRF